MCNSELDWAEARLLTSKVPWQIGVGRKLFAVVGLLVIPHSWLGPGGFLIGGGFDSSLILLPLSSLMYSKEMSISFASSYISSLDNWLGCFAIVCLLNIIGYIMTF